MKAHKGKPKLDKNVIFFWQLKIELQHFDQLQTHNRNMFNLKKKHTAWFKIVLFSLTLPNEGALPKISPGANKWAKCKMNCARLILLLITHVFSSNLVQQG